MKHPLKPIAQMTFGEIQKEFSILRNISNKLGMKINLLKEIVSKLKSASPFDLAPLINEVETKINDLGDFKLSDKTDRPKQMTGKTFKTKEKVKEYLKTKPLTTFELYELLVKDGILLSKEENDKEYGNFRGIISTMFNNDEDIERTEDRRGAPWKLVEAIQLKIDDNESL